MCYNNLYIFVKHVKQQIYLCILIICILNLFFYLYRMQMNTKKVTFKIYRM